MRNEYERISKRSKEVNLEIELTAKLEEHLEKLKQQMVKLVKSCWKILDMHRCQSLARCFD